jgi:hypothetical protein
LRHCRAAPKAWPAGRRRRGESRSKGARA